MRQLELEHAKQREIAAAADQAIKSHAAKVKLLEAEKRLMAERDDENRKAASRRQLAGHAADRQRQGVEEKLGAWQARAGELEAAMEEKDHALAERDGEIAALRERVSRANARADQAALAQTAALFEHEADAKARLAEVAAAEAHI